MIATVPFITPIFYDKFVQDVNTKLDALGWISKVYPVAWMGYEAEGTFPEVYYNNGSRKNIRVMPEGAAISFWQVDGDIMEVEEFHFQAQMSLTVWADLRKVNSSKSYDYTPELIKDVVNVLRKSSCNDLVISVDQVMDEFSYLQKVLQQNTMRPYTAFKIDFSCLVGICHEWGEGVVTELANMDTFTDGETTMNIGIKDGVLAIWDEEDEILYNT